MRVVKSLLVRILITGICLLPASNGSVAQTTNALPYTKENIAPVSVFLRDGATGGCWTNLNEAKDYAQGQLDLAGIEVIDGPGAKTSFEVTVLSSRLQNELCYGSVEIALMGFVGWGNGRAPVALRSFSNPFANARNVNTTVLDMIKSVISVDLGSLPKTN